MREAIGRSPDVGLTLLLLKLVTDTFRSSSASGSCLKISVRHVYISDQTWLHMYCGRLLSQARSENAERIVKQILEAA